MAAMTSLMISAFDDQRRIAPESRAAGFSRRLSRPSDGAFGSEHGASIEVEKHIVGDSTARLNGFPLERRPCDCSPDDQTEPAPSMRMRASIVNNEVYEALAAGSIPTR
jgi:hypothetical protein